MTKHPFRPTPDILSPKFKQLDLHDCNLSPSRIDIWEYPLLTIWDGAREILNSNEIDRADRFYFERHRRRFTVARSMMRLILAHYLKEKASQLTFRENKYGKPEIKHPSQIEFNLSHSQDLALLVVGKNHPVGIDLEFFSGRSYLGIGDQLFSEAENNALKKTPLYLRSLSFFTIWAQKEAFIKACGLGLSYPTKSFNVASLPNESSDIEDPLHQSTWRTTTFMPKIACAAAVCYHPSIREIRYIRVLPPHDNTP